MLRRKKTIREVQLDGLEICIPPGNSGSLNAKVYQALSMVEIQTLMADAAVLRLLPELPQQPPRVWNLEALTLKTIGVDLPVRFDSVIVSEAPSLRIKTAGEFGPWNPDAYNLTPLSGIYTVLPGSVQGLFPGIVSSTGTFDGTLDELRVDGSFQISETDTDGSNEIASVESRFQGVVRPLHLRLR
jgi:hypothetical protein